MKEIRRTKVRRTSDRILDAVETVYDQGRRLLDVIRGGEIGSGNIAVHRIALFNHATGYLLSQRVFEPLNR